jgi:hypothetical protein
MWCNGLSKSVKRIWKYVPADCQLLILDSEPHGNKVAPFEPQGNKVVPLDVSPTISFLCVIHSLLY